jgi:predicted unusual protein kinase regulating ubiquinone biosynthesis (AarF/ABC1/UbiB family)
MTSRRYQRWLAFAAAQLKRATATAKQAVLSDVDVTADKRAADLAEAAAFASAAGELGAAMAKVAQVRAYLDVAGAAATPEARALLSRLWDRMPPRDPAEIRRVVENTLGSPLSKHFTEWDDRPLAAASLGQVHAATGGGERLAVKVQYPGVAEALRDDLASPKMLERLLGGELSENAAADALDVLRAQLLSELDYAAEAKHLQRFARAYANDKSIIIPRVDLSRSGDRVLSMQRLDGMPLAEFESQPQAERDAVAATIFRFGVGAPLAHGCFNADPHPGNYLVLDGAAGKVGFVDFGSVAELPDEMRAADKQLWLALIHRDGEALRHAAHRQGLVAAADTFESATWREWERAFGEPFLTRKETELSPPQVTTLIARTGELLRLRRIALPPGAIVLWRQRLGMLSVLAGLRPKLRFRQLLAELLDDGRNPIPLFDRWR